jgi:hypothetical protein
MLKTSRTTRTTKKGTGKASGKSNQSMPSAQKSTSIGSMIDETMMDPAIATTMIAKTTAKVNIAACNYDTVAIATTTTSNQSMPSMQKSASSGSMIDEMTADPAITTTTIAKTTAGIIIAACHDNDVATAITTTSTTIAKERSGTPAIAKMSLGGSIAGTGSTIASTTTTNTATVDTGAKKLMGIKKTTSKKCKKVQHVVQERKRKVTTR